MQDRSPLVVAIDSPRSCAPSGHTARDDERRLSRKVCGIRWTPDEAQVNDGRRYYEWIRCGLRLYDRLRSMPTETVEVFPTASWTRWCGPRGAQSRARWSRAGLASLGLRGVPERTNQDQRDTIAAAVTAREYTGASCRTLR